MPPLPKNKPESEEFRDRLIWCHLVSYSKTTDSSIIIVSNDGIFENGAGSQEGREARIENVKDEADLDQRLDQRPTHIQEIVDKLFEFTELFKSKGIDIKQDSIVGIDNLRKTRDSNGLMTNKFTLLLKNIENIPLSTYATMVCLGEKPITLNLYSDEPVVFLEKHFSPQELNKLNFDRLRGTANLEQAESELKVIIED